MNFKKTASFILSVIVAVSSLNICLAEADSEVPSEDIAISEAADEYSASPISDNGLIEYALPEGNIYFHPDTGGIISSDMSITRADIPSSIEGYPVLYIGEAAFEDNLSLESVNIPEGVVRINRYAFSRCDNLKEVNIPSSVETIGFSAFYACINLNNLTLNKGIASIGEKAFWCCRSLTDLDIPDSVSYIGKGAFSACSSLTDVSIPDSVTSIDMGAFSSCTSLKSIKLPGNIASVGGDILYNCTSLTDVYIPDSVTSIDESAFDGCTSLKSIILPNNVKSIKDYAFNYCTSLRNITIPESVTYINNTAFTNCNKNLLILHVKQGSYADTWAKNNSFKVYYDIPDTTITTTENTTKSAADTTTETTTLSVVTSTTESTTKSATVSGTGSGGGGGGGGGSSSHKTTTTTTATTEATTEATTTEATTASEKHTETTTENKAISGDVKVSIGSNEIIIKNKKYKTDTAAYIQPESNSTLVPLRFVALAIAGGDIEKADSSKNINWDSAAKTATISAEGNVISFTAGSELMTINNNPQIMENGVKAEIKDSRMFIPFRALGKALGVQVDWDAESKTAIYKAK